MTIKAENKFFNYLINLLTLKYSVKKCINEKFIKQKKKIEYAEVATGLKVRALKQ